MEERKQKAGPLAALAGLLAMKAKQEESLQMTHHSRPYQAQLYHRWSQGSHQGWESVSSCWTVAGRYRQWRGDWL